MTAQNTAQVQNPTVNGVNVDQLMNVITSIEQNAEMPSSSFG